MEKKTLIGVVVVIVILVAGLSVALLWKPPAPPAPPQLYKPPKPPAGAGPVGTIYLSVRTTQEGGVTDVGYGTLDVFLWPVSGRIITTLPPEVLANVKPIRASTGYWSLIFNPVYNKTLAQQYNLPVWPIIRTGGKEYFNPFAIREIRYAMNFLVSRKDIINLIIAGFGEPMYSPVMLSEPAGPIFTGIYDELGLTPEGDLQAALKMINDSMTKWMEIVNEKVGEGTVTFEKDPNAPAGGVGGWWKFGGDYITVKFYIRIEDERHEEGLHVADLIEMAGIKVERIEADRRTCIYTVYLTDPAAYEWNIYTEGWVSMTSYKYPEWAITQMYAPWLGWMPGIQVPGWWQYENDTLDELTLHAIFEATDETDYWNTLKEAVKVGIQESVRVFVCVTYEYFVVNKNTVTALAYDIGGGLWSRWGLVTLMTTTGTATIAEFSSAAALFMSAFNPVGGFEDVYSELVRGVLHDPGMYTHPLTGEPIPVRVNYTDVEKGTFTLPDTVLIYNSTAKKWVPASQTGIKAATVKVTFKYLFSRWHHGIMMDMNDIKYWIAFMYDWATMDYEGDPFYDDAYASSILPYLETIAGWEFVDEDTLVVYGNYSHPISDAVTASYYYVWPDVPWEIGEIMAWTVAYGGPKSGNAYSWDGRAGTEWIDLLATTHCEDMLQWFGNFTATSYVPDYIKDSVTWDEAKTRYETVKLFYNEYGHLYVGNGPFYLAEYDPDAIYMKLEAFWTDETYPFNATYWLEKFAFTPPEISSVELPEVVPLSATGNFNESFTINVTVTVGGTPAAGYTVEIYIRDPSGALIWTETGTTDSNGFISFEVDPSEVTLPAGGLTAGTYTVEIRTYEQMGAVPTVIFTYFAVTSGG